MQNKTINATQDQIEVKGWSKTDRIIEMKTERK